MWGFQMWNWQPCCSHSQTDIKIKSDGPGPHRNFICAEQNIQNNWELMNVTCFLTHSYVSLEKASVCMSGSWMRPILLTHQVIRFRNHANWETPSSCFIHPIPVIIHWAIWLMESVLNNAWASKVMKSVYRLQLEKECDFMRRNETPVRIYF